jgi:DDE_Tnp_1-associated
MATPTGIALWDHFAALPDPRQHAKVSYPLSEILLLVLSATIAGADNFVETTLWGTQHLTFLRRFYRYESGIPSHDKLCDVRFRTFSTRRAGYPILPVQLPHMVMGMSSFQMAIHVRLRSCASATDCLDHAPPVANRPIAISRSIAVIACPTAARDVRPPRQRTSGAGLDNTITGSAACG